MPVESEPAVAEIHFHKIRLTVKGKSTRVLDYLKKKITLMAFAIINNYSLYTFTYKFIIRIIHILNNYIWT